MKHLSKLVLCFSILICAGVTKADEDDEAKEKAEMKNSKSSNESLEGFKISAASQKRFGVKMVAVHGDFSNLEVPQSSLVYHQNEVGIFRVRNESFKLLEIKILSKANTTTKIKCNELQSGDFIVTEGAPLLRVAEIAEKNGIEGEGL